MALYKFNYENVLPFFKTSQKTKNSDDEKFSGRKVRNLEQDVSSMCYWGSITMIIQDSIYGNLAYKLFDAGYKYIM